MKLSLDILPFFIWVCGVYGLHLWFLSFGVSNSLSLLVLWSCYLGCEIYDFFVRFVKYIWVFVNNLVFNLFRLMLVVKHCWGLLGRRYEKHCIIQIHTSIGPSIPVVALHDMYMYIYIYIYILYSFMFFICVLVEWISCLKGQRMKILVVASLLFSKYVTDKGCRVRVV